MDIQQEINELKSKIAGFEVQLATSTGDEKIALLNAIASYNYQLTELYKHLPSQAPPTGIFRSIMISK